MKQQKCNKGFGVQRGSNLQVRIIFLSNIIETDLSF